MVFIFILLNLVMLLAAHLTAYRYFKKANYSEQLITTFLIYACQITFSILFLGVAVKELGLPWIFLFNAAISLPVIWVLRKTIKKSIHHSHEKILGFSKDIFRAKDFFLYLFVFLFLTQIVLLLIKIYYLPSHVWDAFAYHLHPIAEWTQQDMIPPAIDSSVTRINRNPLGSKVFHLWSFMSIGDIRWIELPQFIFGLIVTLTSYSLMVKLNLRKTAALKYAILIFFIPSILIESRTCQDHLVLTGAIMIAVLYFINIFYQKQFSQIPFLALSLGLLLGIKISSPQVILVLFIALLAGKGFDRKQVWEFLSKNRAKIGAGLLIILALGSYWFFRSSAVLESYGSIARSVFSLKVLLIICLISAIILLTAKGITKLQARKKGKTAKNRKIFIAAAVIIAVLLGSYGIFSHMSLLKTFLPALQSPKHLLSDPALYEQYPLLKLTRSRFQYNLLLFPFRIKDTGAYMPYSPSLWKQSGFGVQFFTFGLISYIIMAGLFIAKRKYRTGIAGFIFIFSTLLLGSYFFYYFSDVNYRMFMFFPVFGIILWAFIQAKTRLNTHRPYYSKYIDALISVMLLFNMAVCVYEGNIAPHRLKNLFSISNHQDRTPIKYSPYLKRTSWQFIDTHIAPSEPVAYLGHYDSWIFPYYDNRLTRKVYHLPTLAGFRLVRKKNKKMKLLFTPAFKKSLKQRGIHYIHLNLERYRHRRDKGRDILIEDTDVCRVSPNLFYLKF